MLDVVPADRGTGREDYEKDKGFGNCYFDSSCNKASELDAVIADSTKELAQWKGTKMRLYEWYKAGEDSREEYMERIEKGRVRMEELERARCEAQAELDRMQEVSGSEEISDVELTGLSELEIFDKDRLKALIEKVIVYGEDAMEIVWKVRNPFEGEVSA